MIKESSANVGRDAETKVIPTQDIDLHGRPSYRDAVDNATVFIDLEHHKIHEGEAWFVSDIDTDIDTAAAKYWRFTAPNTSKRIHFKWVISVKAEAIIYFYENPTLDAAGTALSVRNCDRNFTGTASTLTAFYDATTTDDGTLMKVFLLGANNPSTRMGGGDKGGVRVDFEAGRGLRDEGCHDGKRQHGHHNSRVV